jgi:uncharacterized protein YjiS (DUF1127 family)
MRTGLSMAAAHAATAAHPVRHGTRTAAPRGGGSRWLARLVILLRALRRRHRRRVAARELRAALHDLDDRTLRDLGFHRDEIASVAAELGGDAMPTRVRTLRDAYGPTL